MGNCLGTKLKNGSLPTKFPRDCNEVKSEFPEKCIPYPVKHDPQSRKQPNVQILTNNDKNTIVGRLSVSEHPQLSNHPQTPKHLQTPGRPIDPSLIIVPPAPRLSISGHENVLLSPPLHSPRSNSKYQNTLYSSPPPLPPLPPFDDLITRLLAPSIEFSFKGETYLGLCVKVYDGDTVTLNMPTKIGTHLWKIRLNDFDAPELSTAKTPLEKTHALACRDVLSDLILNKCCIVQCGKFDMYGRILGTIYTKMVSKGDKKNNNEENTNDNNTNDNNNNNTNESREEGEKSHQLLTEHCLETDLKRIGDLLNTSEWMLQNTSCVPYSGGHKDEINYEGRPFHPVYQSYVQKYLANNNKAVVHHRLKKLSHIPDPRFV